MHKPRLIQSLAALGSSLFLAASLAIPASAASRPPGSPAHRSASGIAVTGTVMTSGKADAGVKVYIHAWPDQSVVQALKIGQMVSLVLVGSATTNASGQYSISLPVAKLAPEATSGVVNLVADSASGEEYFPLVITKNAGNAYLGTGNPVVNLAATRTKSKPPCSASDESMRYIKSLGKHWATVGQTYVDTSQAHQQFSYYEGQSSTIGAGTSNTGDYGSFAADGSFSWTKSGSHSTGGSWPSYGPHQAYLYRTQFHFAEYRCYILGVETKQRVQLVNGYEGGAHHERTTFPRARYCESYDQGYNFYSNNTRAETWRHTWGIHAGLGFFASVVTGYDKNAIVHYHLYRERNICGSNADPGADPRLMVVR